MKFIFFSLFAFLTLSAQAEFECLPEPVPQTIFAGMPQKIKATFRNTGEKPVEIDLRTRLFQVSSATMMPLGNPQSWKKLQVLPGQTVIETASFEVPVIKTQTRFQIHWLDEKGSKMGRTDLMAYPEDMLKQLKTLAGEKPLGIMDPSNQLKPILEKLKIEFAELNQEKFDSFDGKLMIAVFTSKDQLPSAEDMKKLLARVKQGVSTVWVAPESSLAKTSHHLVHSFQLGTASFVVAHPNTISNLSTSAASQLNLLDFAEKALKIDAFSLLENSQP
jgi:hypothetical protein